MTTRVRVGSTDLLNDGQMKEVPFPNPDSESKVLLSKVKGQYYATSSKCTHYGAPLAKGVLTAEGRLVCNGDIEDAPGIDSLQAFKVETDGSSIFIHANADTVTQTRQPSAPKVDISSDSSHADVLIIGGGSGAAFTIEALREEGFSGSIKVVTREPHYPIDRTKISKALLSDPEKLALRKPEFYQKQKVDFVLGTDATKLDFASSSVQLSNGSSVSYENLILATGAFPVKLPLDGANLGNMFTVRGVKDAEAINAAVGPPEKDEDKKNVVVVGSSFIGMEVALALSGKAKVSVVGMDDVPFAKILGEQIGSGIRKFHEGKGTKFYLPAELSHFEPKKDDSKNVGSVHLKDGTTLPADVVILGVGVKPATELLKDAGLELLKNGTVKTDTFLEVEQLKGKNKGRVFALGDIATHDTPKGTNYIQHWNVAGNHGRSIAHTIATKQPQPFDKVAVFWSAQGQQLRYCGTPQSSSFDDIHIDGNPDELNFVAYYFMGEQVVASASMQRDPIVARVSELLKLEKMLTKSEIKAGKSPMDVPLA
ncbi:Apoptosis-inducing factor 1 [Rhodotorula sphaerocarpa]